MGLDDMRIASTDKKQIMLKGTYAKYTAQAVSNYILKL